MPSEQEVFEREAQRLEDLCAYVTKRGYTVDCDDGPPPKLNPDGSLVDPVANFNPHHDEHGHFASGDTAAHDLEHAHHDLHQAHEAYELFSGHLEVPAHVSISDAVALVSAAPGVGKLVVDLHDKCKETSDRLIHAMQQRYGKATTAGVLGSGALLAAAARHSMHLGPLGKLIPGQNLAASIPLAALAETGRALGLVHPNSALERVSMKTGEIVHALRGKIVEPIKGGVGAVAKEMDSTFMKSAHAAGRLAGKAVEKFKEQWHGVANADVDKLATGLIDGLYNAHFSATENGGPGSGPRKQLGFILPDGVKSVEKAPDHEFTGTKLVTLDNGNVHPIFFDKATGAYWHENHVTDPDRMRGYLGEKRDALDRLVKEQHNLKPN